MNDQTLVLTESQSARISAIANVTDDRAAEILNKAKALVMALWQGTGAATTEQMADYYEVPVETVQSFVKNNRSELESDGLHVAKGKDLKALKNIVMLSNNITNLSSIHRLTVWTPRAALRLGMLLRDSEVAMQVRTVLLDTTMQAKPEKQEVSLLSLASSENFEEALVVLLATIREKKQLAAANEQLLQDKQALQVEVQTLEPKAERYDLVMDSDGWLTGDQICKQLAIRKFSTVKLYEILREEKILFKRPDGANYPYAEWVNDGLAKLRNGQCFDGRMRFSPVFSWKGLDRILDILRKHQVIPRDKQFQFNFDSNKAPEMKRA